MKESPTYQATIHIGLKYMDQGLHYSVEEVEEYCKSFSAKNDVCMSFTKTKYIYPYGTETGVIIQFIQFPLNPKKEGVILSYAMELAGLLMNEFNQRMVTVIASDKTYSKELINSIA